MWSAFVFPFVYLESFACINLSEVTEDTSGGRHAAVGEHRGVWRGVVVLPSDLEMLIRVGVRLLLTKVCSYEACSIFISFTRAWESLSHFVECLEILTTARTNLVTSGYRLKA